MTGSDLAVDLTEKCLMITTILILTNRVQMKPAPSIRRFNFYYTEFPFNLFMQNFNDVKIFCWKILSVYIMIMTNIYQYIDLNLNLHSI
jgi:hypothetical protein